MAQHIEDKESRQDRIVVGIDGSEASRRAFTWALAEAEQRGARLDVITAWTAPYSWAEGFNDKWPEDHDHFARQAFDEAAASVDDWLDGKPRPSWLHLTAVEGPPAQVLLAHAVGADLLVLGARGRGGFASLLLGSVSTACVHHAPCPVAVIRDVVGGRS